MKPDYRWRKLTEPQRAELLTWRKNRKYPWHSPPHRSETNVSLYHVTAACYEHCPLIGSQPQRMDRFCTDLLAVLGNNCTSICAWCVLPNHYHALVDTQDVHGLLRCLGRFHGRTSHAWNGEEKTRGRKVFYRTVERAMRSERHVWTTLNYVHHNPVHHGYVERWTEWPWSSAAEYLAQTGLDEAKRIWREYPLDEYGTGWDDARL